MQRHSCRTAREYHTGSQKVRCRT
ncbi:MAG: hypothetical protein IK990_20135 [Ruminiclostridium sp.]|nr:hypothetical protein [Ruminiclostridium sp.]